MSHIYRVPKRDGSFVLVQAKTGPRAVAEARKAVFADDVVATRLTAGQILAAARSGIDVLVVDSDPLDSDIQPDLPGVDTGEGE